VLVKSRECNTLIKETVDETLPFVLIDQQLLEGGDDEIYPIGVLGVGRGI